MHIFLDADQQIFHHYTHDLQKQMTFFVLIRIISTLSNIQTSNIPVLNLIVGSRNMIEVSENISFEKNR